MSIDNLAAALAAVQADLPSIVKGETATVPTKSGGQYKYSYADLADVSQVILPLLGKHGLSWITRPTLTDGRFVLAYELLHTSGESRTGEYPLPDRGTPQEIGSAITYARRYALCAVTGVAPAADDDDGAAATQRAQRERFEDARPARPTQDAEQRRAGVVANARKAIAEATEQDALDGIGKRLTYAEQSGWITGDDAVDLRRLLVARIDELFPAGEQPAIDGQQPMDADWPEPARPAQGDPA